MQLKIEKKSLNTGCFHTFFCDVIRKANPIIPNPRDNRTIKNNIVPVKQQPSLIIYDIVFVLYRLDHIIGRTYDYLSFPKGTASISGDNHFPA